MNFITSILGQVLKALLGFFQERREADKTREQLDRLAREAERSRLELERARKNLETAKNHSEIAESVRNLDDNAALDKLRNAVRRSAPTP